MSVKFKSIRGNLKVISKVISQEGSDSIGHVYIDLEQVKNAPLFWTTDPPLSAKEVYELEKLLIPIIRMFDKKIAEAVGGYLSQIVEED